MLAFRASSEQFLRGTPVVLQSARGVLARNAEIHGKKRLSYALRYIKGDWIRRRRQLLGCLQIVNKPTWQLTALELETLRNEVLNYNIGHNLIYNFLFNYDKEYLHLRTKTIVIQCYRGIRHVDDLPCGR